MCNVLALLASFVHVYWLYVLLRVLVGVCVGKKDLFQIGSGKGSPDPAFPHFPSAPFFNENPASRTSHSFHASRKMPRSPRLAHKAPVMQAVTIFPKSSASRAHILASHFPSSSQIPYPI